MDVIGPSISVSGPRKEFFNGTFGIWLGGKKIQMDSEDQSECTKYGVS